MDHAMGGLMFMEAENYDRVDALPYIDTQLGQPEVARQVKALIEEEMQHFDARDYLASLPAPALPLINGPEMQKEFTRIEAGKALDGIDISRYNVEVPKGASNQDHGAWRSLAENVNMQLEYNRLRITNLDMLERWGNKAWIAHSLTVRGCERVLTNEAAALRASREEVNKKRKLDQVSCGNELRKLTLELEQYQRDNVEVEQGLRNLDGEIQRLRRAAQERDVYISDIIEDDT
eukprot:TRINITY_DN24086_c0_g1_i5.p1 TRINITY_DN24086_c0_g1~~TRINITY_DN24086_c0_g1_i5.p1  ORF type:complete len:234 (+),score=52.51 TRINITY_DN24086_c0_g1_i5:83-784(+)